MLKISEKALELLRVKLDLTSDEQKIIRDELITDSEIQSTIIKIKKDTESEKTILSDILSSFVAINASFDSVIRLLSGTQALTTVGLEAPPTPDAFVVQDKSKPDSRKKGGGLLGTLLGLGAFAFSPAIIKFLTEDPEKIGESLNAAFTWLKEDLPNFFKNDFIPFIKQYLDAEIIGNITGMDILKSAGIATALFAGKGIILNLLTKALLNTTGWFLKSFFGFLVSPAGLAILVGAGIGITLYNAFQGAVDKGNEGSNEYQQKRIEAENKRVDTFIESLNKSGVLARGNIKAQTIKDAFLTKNKETGEYIGLKIPPGHLDFIEKQVEEIGSKPPDANDSAKQDKLNEVINLLSKVGVQSEAPILAETGQPAEALGINPRTGETVYGEGGTVADRARARRAREKELRSTAGETRQAVPESTPSASSNMAQATPEANADGSVPVSSETTSEKTDAIKTPSSAGEIPNIDAINDSLNKMSSQDKGLYKDTISDLLMSGVSKKALDEAGGDPIAAKELESLYPEINWYGKETSVGSDIEKATVDISKPKKQKPIVIPAPAPVPSNRTLTVKPGQTWNINDVPDPSPILGNLFSQLFVPETSFSGAINV